MPPSSLGCPVLGLPIPVKDGSHVVLAHAWGLSKVLPPPAQPLSLCQVPFLPLLSQLPPKALEHSIYNTIAPQVCFLGPSLEWATERGMGNIATLANSKTGTAAKPQPGGQECLESDMGLRVLESLTGLWGLELALGVGGLRAWSWGPEG